MASLLIAVVLYYFILLVENRNPDIYSTVSISERFPFVDLQEKKFVFVVRPVYG